MWKYMKSVLSREGELLFGNWFMASWCFLNEKYILIHNRIRQSSVAIRIKLNIFFLEGSTQNQIEYMKLRIPQRISESIYILNYFSAILPPRSDCFHLDSIFSNNKPIQSLSTKKKHHTGEKHLFQFIFKIGLNGVQLGWRDPSVIICS